MRQFLTLLRCVPHKRNLLHVNFRIPISTTVSIKRTQILSCECQVLGYPTNTDRVPPVAQVEFCGRAWSIIERFFQNIHIHISARSVVNVPMTTTELFKNFDALEKKCIFYRLIDD